MSSSGRTEFELVLDYGMSWPIKDWDLEPENVPAWSELLSPELCNDLRAWCAFFNTYADETTGLFGSEERRRWFDLEGFRLRDELEKQAGHLYSFRLTLWF